MLDLVEEVRRAIEGGYLYLAVFNDFSVASNSLFTSYILAFMTGAGLSKEFASS